MQVAHIKELGCKSFLSHYHKQHLFFLNMRKTVGENQFKVDLRVVAEVVAVHFSCLKTSRPLCTKFDDFFKISRHTHFS